MQSKFASHSILLALIAGMTLSDSNKKNKRFNATNVIALNFGRLESLI